MAGEFPGPNPMTYQFKIEDRNLTITAILKDHQNNVQRKESIDHESILSNIDCGSTTIMLESYRSYGLMFGKFRSIDHNKTLYHGNVKLVDYCRLGISSRETFWNIPDFWIHEPIGQFDTGLIEGNDPQMALTLFNKYNAENTLVYDGDVEYLITLPSNTFYPHYSMPRFKLWDRYAISIDDTELQAIQSGRYINRDENIVDVPARDILEIDIKKYTADFSKVLNRPIDSHEISIETTCGVLRSTRIDLNRGTGKAYLHTLGHTGRFKLKLGWRWYPVWCEYNLNLV